MNQAQEQRLIADIKQVLESQTLDSDARLALQKARALALAKSTTSWHKLPWLPFAVTASLIAVLAINLPTNKTEQALVAKPETEALNNPLSKVSAKPIATVVEKPVAIKSVAVKASVDEDLLENLELYEDAEFYQWLSEQDSQGATDA